MQQTTNYNLNKFDSTDALENTTRLGLNENADTIDTTLKALQDDIDGLDAADVSYDNTVSGLTADNVQGAIDELGSLPTPITLTPTKAGVSNYSNYGNSYYYKIGTRVHIHLGLRGLTSMAANHIFTMPEGYRPYNVSTAMGSGGSSYDKFMAMTVNGTNGDINVYGNDTYANIDLEYDAFN